MSSLESEKILSTFGTRNMIAQRSLQKASQRQLNTPSTGNTKKENKINFHERHFPKTLAFLGWYYILKIQCVSSLVHCCQHLKSSNFVCLLHFFSLSGLPSNFILFSYFSPSKAFMSKFPCSFKLFQYLQNPSASDIFLLLYRVKIKIT